MSDKRREFRVFQGLPLVLEYLPGDVRTGKSPTTGKTWKRPMVAAYGYVRGSKGLDGDAVDIYLGTNPDSNTAYIIDQMKGPDFQVVDEQKVVLGCVSPREAKKLYLAHYPDARFFGSIVGIPMDKFKEKVMDKDLQGKKLASSADFIKKRMIAGMKKRFGELSDADIKGISDNAEKYVAGRRALKDNPKKVMFTADAEDARESLRAHIRFKKNPKPADRSQFSETSVPDPKKVVAPKRRSADPDAVIRPRHLEAINNATVGLGVAGTGLGVYMGRRRAKAMDQSRRQKNETRERNKKAGAIDVLGNAAVGGLIGSGVGRLTGDALDRYPGQSREAGSTAGTIAGMVSGGWNRFKVLDAVRRIQHARELGGVLRGGDKASLYGRTALNTLGMFAPEVLASAAAVALGANKDRSKMKGTEKQAELHEGDEALLRGAGGVAGVGAGGVLLSKARPHVTGRQRLYHGTTGEAARKVRESGLLPAAAVDTPAITDILADDIKADAKKLVYLTPKRMEAGGYAGQADFIAANPKNFLSPLLMPQRAKATVKGMLNPVHPGIVTADVPTWKPEIADKIKKNPEARGSFDEFRKHVRSKMLFPPPDDQIRALHKSLDRAVAIDGGVPAEFIRGSDKFKKLTLREMKEYARARPGRFAGGLGLGALGLASVGAGASTLADIGSRQKEAAADREARIANAVDNVGLGMLAAPSAAYMTGSLLKRIPKTRAAGAALQQRVNDFHGANYHAMEMAGLGLVSPTISHGIAKRIDKALPGAEKVAFFRALAPATARLLKAEGADAAASAARAAQYSSAAAKPSVMSRIRSAVTPSSATSRLARADAAAPQAGTVLQYNQLVRNAPTATPRPQTRNPVRVSLGQRVANPPPANAGANAPVLPQAKPGTPPLQTNPPPANVGANAPGTAAPTPTPTTGPTPTTPGRKTLFTGKNIAGAAAMGTIGLGLYGGKKAIDTVASLATPHETDWSMPSPYGLPRAF